MKDAERVTRVLGCRHHPVGHQRKQIGNTPMRLDLAVANPHRVHRLKADLAAGRRDAQERALVRAVIRLERGHDLAVGRFPMDLGAKVGKGSTKCLIERPRPGLVGGHIRLRGEVDEIVREHLLDNSEVALALHFLGITAHHRLGRLV